VKTVATVRLADTTDAVVLPDLPEEIALAMRDIAGAAREGLLAMSVAAGLAVMQAMFEAEITEIPPPTPGCATLKASPHNWIRAIPARPRRCVTGWRRYSPSRGWASTAGSRKH
jgi:hypothetical protein